LFIKSGGKERQFALPDFYSKFIFLKTQYYLPFKIFTKRLNQSYLLVKKKLVRAFIALLRISQKHSGEHPKLSGER